MKFRINMWKRQTTLFLRVFHVIFHLLLICGPGTKAQAPRQRQIACRCSEGGGVSARTLGGANPTQVNLHYGDTSWSHQVDGYPGFLHPGLEKCHNPLVSLNFPIMSHDIRNHPAQTCSVNVKAFSDNVRFISNSVRHFFDNVRNFPKMAGLDIWRHSRTERSAMFYSKVCGLFDKCLLLNLSVSVRIFPAMSDLIPTSDWL